MNIRNFESCDFLLTNLVNLYVSRPQDCTVTEKPIAYPVRLVNAANINDTSLDVDSVPLTLPGNLEIDFGGVKVLTSALTPIGSTTIPVFPLTQGILPDTTATVEQLFPVLSISQADNTKDGTVISDRDFRNAEYVTNREVSNGFTLNLEGTYVRKDAGLYFCRIAAHALDRVWFKLDDSIDIYEGFGYIVNFNEGRQNDAHRKVSFGLLVDGNPNYGGIPTVVAEFLQDEEGMNVLDEESRGIITV